MDKKLDVFKLGKMFFHVNISNVHWALCVADMSERVITYYDSLCGDGKKYLQALHRYSQDEFSSRKGGSLPDSDKWILKSCALEHQSNGFDCGIFVFAYALYLSVNKEIDFNQGDMKHLRKHMALYIARQRLY
jgi:sentrin-specific protease 1